MQQQIDLRIAPPGSSIIPLGDAQAIVTPPQSDLDSDGTILKRTTSIIAR
jgi:hypothetical protein